MKYNYKKMSIVILMVITIMLFLNLNSFAHSGRTDSNGGHKDKNNVSGLGSYHYHCGGYPAHLHKNGVCPYSSSSTSSSGKSKSTTSSSIKSSSSKSSKSTSTSKSSNTKSNKSTSTSKTSTNSNKPTTLPNAKTTSATPTTIAATGIEINEIIYSMNIGENKKLTATITPSNATDKNITWKTSDESIAIVSSTGEITAKGSGVVNITASTSNGKTSTVKINVKEGIKEETKEEKNTTTNISTLNSTNTNSNVEKTNIIGGILALGLLAGGGYWGYKKISKKSLLL